MNKLSAATYRFHLSWAIWVARRRQKLWYRRFAKEVLAHGAGSDEAKFILGKMQGVAEGIDELYELREDINHD